MVLFLSKNRGVVSLGVVFSVGSALALGVGLMGLLFLSLFHVFLGWDLFAAAAALPVARAVLHQASQASEKM